MIKVSVLVITYNHEKYIRQTLDSILSQKVSFPIEILVGDDASTDKTAEIIREYHSKFPEIIVPFLHPKNMGLNGLTNTLETIQHAKGEYIAAMDGDDYWIDELKLQKQVDFLDKNSDFSACFHNAKITYFESEKIDFVNDISQKEIIELEDLIGEDEIWFMATSAVMFRNGLLEYPDWFKKSSSGDIPRYVLLAKKGKIKYLSDVMSVYRKHLAGSSFSDNYVNAEFLSNRIMMYEGINETTAFRFDKTLKKNIARYYQMMLESKQYKNDYWGRIGILRKIASLKKISSSEKKIFFRDYILPTPFLKIYSFFALLPKKFS